MMKLDRTKLLNARLDKGWSQEEAAEMAGVSPTTYNRAESGLPIHPSTGKQIADALVVPLAELRVPTEGPDLPIPTTPEAEAEAIDALKDGSR